MSARFIAAISVGYAAITVVGFVSIGSLTAPLPDPSLGIVAGVVVDMAVICAAVMAWVPPRRTSSTVTSDRSSWA